MGNSLTGSKTVDHLAPLKARGKICLIHEMLLQSVTGVYLLSCILVQAS